MLLLPTSIPPPKIFLLLPLMLLLLLLPYPPLNHLPTFLLVCSFVCSFVCLFVSFLLLLLLMHLLMSPPTPIQKSMITASNASVVLSAPSPPPPPPSLPNKTVNFHSYCVLRCCRFLIFICSFLELLLLFEQWDTGKKATAVEAIVLKWPNDLLNFLFQQ